MDDDYLPVFYFLFERAEGIKGCESCDVLGSVCPFFQALVAESDVTVNERRAQVGVHQLPDICHGNFAFVATLHLFPQDRASLTFDPSSSADDWVVSIASIQAQHKNLFPLTNDKLIVL